MHLGIRRILAIALLLSALAGFGAAEGELAPLKVDLSGGHPPKAENYLSDREYKDASISVVIGEGREYDTVYMYAHIKIADPTQLRTAPASSFYKCDPLMASDIAKKHNAVVAINGDSYLRRKAGFIIRQGKNYRNSPIREDLLLVDSNGDMHGVFAANKRAVEAFMAALPDGVTIWNTFSFGPILVENGEVAVSDFINYENVGAQNQAQRACIAQLGKLEYLIVSSEGPEDPDETGMTIPQFAKTVQKIGASLSETGVRIAYNLDGGSSNTLVFQNKKINSPGNPLKRSVPDIIYFATLVP